MQLHDTEDSGVKFQINCNPGAIKQLGAKIIAIKLKKKKQLHNIQIFFKKSICRFRKSEHKKLVIGKNSSENCTEISNYCIKMYSRYLFIYQST